MSLCFKYTDKKEILIQRHLSSTKVAARNESPKLISLSYQRQMLAGSCPLPAASEVPDSGKSTECKLALAAAGGWRTNSLRL